MAEPFGFSIFCDDIRLEQGGKISLMGIYQSEMIFHDVSFPVSFPKFAILVMYYEPSDLEPVDLSVHVYFPGDEPGSPTINSSINRKELTPKIAARTDLEPDMQSVFNARIPIVIQPLLVKQEGFIKVRIIRAGKTLNFGSLKMRAAPSTAAKS